MTVTVKEGEKRPSGRSSRPCFFWSRLEIGTVERIAAVSCEPATDHGSDFRSELLDPFIIININIINITHIEPVLALGATQKTCSRTT